MVKDYIFFANNFTFSPTTSKMGLNNEDEFNVFTILWELMNFNGYVMTKSQYKLRKREKKF